MNEEKKSTGATDVKLSALLRASRVAPPLPPRFQENVWRRIEDAAAPKSAREITWLDAVAALILRPRIALAAAAALVLAGAALGAYRGDQMARQDAQAQYVSAVSAPLTR